MPHLEPQLTARAITPMVSGLRALGHDPLPILASAGIHAASLDDPDARLPMNAVGRLWTNAVDATGDLDLGLHLAERADAGSFEVHLYAMVSSATLGAAFECLRRYQRLIHDTNRVELEIERDRATLRHRKPGGMAIPRQSAEFVVAAWVRAARTATGSLWTPSEVRFAHDAPGDIGEHIRVFGAPPRFGAGENALVFPAADLAMPCLRADASLLTVLERYAADRLELAPRGSSFADRARTLLVEEFHGREPSAERLARRMKMSVRTLSRALAAEGTSYRGLLDRTRTESASRLLADGRVSISEVAFLLGFSELSAFYRAFRRWTGMTPAEFRRRHGPSPSPAP